MKKRLVFIAHSLGGLVCANILAKKTSQSHYSDLIDITSRCVEIVFLATPFYGYDSKAWEKITQKLCPTTKVEKNNSSSAIQVQQAFQTLLANRFSKPAFRVKNLVEDGDEHIPNVVITADSAELNPVTPVAIKADHQSISKCVDKRDLTFEYILESLQKVEMKAAPFDYVQYGTAAHSFTAGHRFYSTQINVGGGAAHNQFGGSQIFVGNQYDASRSGEAKLPKDSDRGSAPAV
jgi:hypothetical protein